MSVEEFQTNSHAWRRRRSRAQFRTIIPDSSNAPAADGCATAQFSFCLSARLSLTSPCGARDGCVPDALICTPRSGLEARCVLLPAARGRTAGLEALASTALRPLLVLALAVAVALAATAPFIMVVAAIVVVLLLVRVCLTVCVYAAACLPVSACVCVCVRACARVCVCVCAGP